MKQDNNKGIELSDEKSLMQFLREPTIKIAETLTGILCSEQKDWKLSTGKLVQAFLKGDLLTQLGREIISYREKGEIKEDCFATRKSRATLYELLKFLDEEVPDEELFTALKSIFFSGVKTSATEYDEALAYEFLQTAQRLSGTEILILKANFELVLGNMKEVLDPEVLKSAQRDRNVWKRIVAKQMGYGELHAIVTKYEKNMESLGLISSRGDDSRFQHEFEPTNKYRLTQMGILFCEYITNYPALSVSSDTASDEPQPDP